MITANTQLVVEELVENDLLADDLLDREEFIDQVFDIIQLFSKQSKTTCFAINGSWGVGKSFVLDKLEKRLEVIQSEETQNNRYILFHYNCWQYDYYDEPLVAIVASMLDTIDEKENLIPDSVKSKIKGLLKTIGNALLIKVNDSIKEKTGVDTKEILEVIFDAKEASDQEIQDENAYDSNFIFKKTLTKLQQTIEVLSEEKTVVFIVDELDRCLPEYAIKVLERLHHVFENTQNVQVILSIDKKQLEHIVKNTFGEGTKTEKYLSKFIKFYVNLDEGIFNDRFEIKFKEYLDNFDYLNEYTKPYQVNEFKVEIFKGIDMRSRIEIIEKCNLLHSLLNKNNEKYDFSIMCLELFLAIINYYDILSRFDLENPNISISNLFKFDKEFHPPALNYLNFVYKNNGKNERKLYFKDDYNDYLNVVNIFGIVLLAFQQILGITETNIHFDFYCSRNLIGYIHGYWSLLKLIN